MKKLSLEQISAERLSESALQKTERFPIYGLLDNIRSLYNVGSIFRTADAVRIQQLFLCGITGQPPRKELDKTALGATKTVPWVYYPDALTAIETLKSKNVQILALEHTSHSQSHWAFTFNFPCCIVVGHEVHGIQQALLDRTDTAIQIPMYGAKHSLNATVAFSIAVYEALKAYQKSKTKQHMVI